MKKYLSFNLLVDITSAMAKFDYEGHLSRKLSDKFEIWPYILDKTANLYFPFGIEVNPFGDNGISCRFNAIKHPWRLAGEKHKFDVKHYASFEEAKLMASIEGIDLMVDDRSPRNIPDHIPFSDIKKHWKRVS